MFDRHLWDVFTTFNASTGGNRHCHWFASIDRIGVGILCLVIHVLWIESIISYPESIIPYMYSVMRNKSRSISFFIDIANTYIVSNENLL